MKISSASKKVLASALSAAMVVAFAPTVAFGKAGDLVTVTIDANGGTGAAIPTYSAAVEGGNIELPALTKNNGAYTISAWKYDSNGDGEFDATLPDYESDGVYNLPTGPSEITGYSSITLKAYYNEPVINTLDLSGANLFVKADNAAAGMVLKAYDVNNNITYTQTLNSTYATNLGTTGVAYPLTELGLTRAEGSFTVKLFDANGNEVASKAMQMVALTFKTAAGVTTSTEYVQKDKNYTPSGNYVNAAGNIVKSGVAFKVTGADTLTAVADAKCMVYGGSYNGAARAITFKYVADDGDTYKVAVKKNGTTIYEKNLAAAASEDTFSFSFDKDYAGDVVNASEEAGAYTAVLTKTVKGTGGAADTVSTAQAQVVLTEMKFEAADFGFVSSFKGTDVFQDNTDFTAAIAAAAANVKAVSGKAVDYWTLNGARVTSDNKVKAGEVNTYAAVAKDVKRNKIANPTIASVTKNADNSYSVALACSDAGAVVKFWNTALPTPAYQAVPAWGLNLAAGTTNFKVQASPVAGVTDTALTTASDEVTFTLGSADASVQGWKTMVNDTLGVYEGLSTTKWSAVEGVKAAIEAGNAAITATTFATATDWEKAVKETTKAVYEAVVAEAKAQAAAYADGAYVVVGAKAYTMKAADLKALNDAIAAQEAYIAKQGANVTLANYTAGVTAIRNAANTALKKAEEAAVTAADITAAQTVTAALKAATTGEAAEKALADYAALTETQKKLVAGADVAAAQKVADEAKAAAELKVAQDDAAVSKARSASKTVKAGKSGKTTKKQSITLKKITSASGAKVTYKKVSGKKAITVKSGKAYLAKGVKKGTYKATVKATCGTQTAKIAVTFKVK